MSKTSGKIIYKAKNFRKKHKPKEFRININFYQKFFSKKKFKTLTVIFLVIILIVGLGSWFFIFRGLPSPYDLRTRKVSLTTSIYDRNGILLYQIYKDQNRTLVPLEQIPKYMQLATVASEDASFYTNHGFSFKGILRAMFTNTKNRELVEGGSTITQQLVKNTLLTPEKTFMRKIKELVLSIRVEATFPKDEILEMYLNEVSYGGTAYGIEAAAQTYFGKDVSQLTLAQAALLAGLPKAPTTYSPLGEHPEISIVRQKEVLRLMFEDGFITKDQETQAEREKLDFLNKNYDIKAPHFVMYVRQKLANTYGEDEVTSGGLNVVTTLDYNIQKIAEEAVKENIEKLRGLHVTNGAAIVIDPHSGEILAMVGSKDYFDVKNNGNVNATLSLRPPGSSIKIVNYAYALSHGFTPATLLMDTPVSFNSPFSPPYSPVNYDEKFVGPITLRNALAQSRNVPAVKVLASYGVDKMVETGKMMGITTWDEKNTYGLSLTLGGGSTKLIDLARVYATVANMGVRPPIKSILNVSDYSGKNLPIDCDTNCESERVLDERVSYQLIDILKDNKARAPEFGFHSALVIENHPEVTVKTGTSNDLRDNLTIGFNQKYLTAIWVGNNDNSPMSRIASGITGAAPIWNEIEGRLLANEEAVEWKIPLHLTQVSICQLTATLSCSGCPTFSEWFLDGTQPTKYCNSDLIKQIIH